MTYLITTEIRKSRINTYIKLLKHCKHFEVILIKQENMATKNVENNVRWSGKKIVDIKVTQVTEKHRQINIKVNSKTNCIYYG